MKIGVYGLWHLGSVYAACLSKIGNKVVAVDEDKQVIDSFHKGVPPIFEPNLRELIENQKESGNLIFSSLVYDLSACDVVFITFDTPVFEDDTADYESIIHKIENLLAILKPNCVVAISSQLPVGSISRLESLSKKDYNDKNIDFCYIPENLRLGNAINAFMHPTRILIGRRTNEFLDNKIKEIFKNLNTNMIFMKTESAEVSKHAINAFLATSVVFGNEIASVCESVGADANEVALGLKSEERIGEKAYLSPGMAFAGGTLARDIVYLNQISDKHKIKNPLLNSVIESNIEHSKWAKNKLSKYLTKLQNSNIAILGLTYKANTDTLRRSHAKELCEFLISKKVNLFLYDAAVKSNIILDHFPSANLVRDLSELDLHSLDALVLFNKMDGISACLKKISIKNNDILIVDPNGFIKNQSLSLNMNYLSVGFDLNE